LGRNMQLCGAFFSEEQMDNERLIESIKQQAELFMLEIGAFYPFGTAIDSNYKIVPIGAYIEDENDNPPSQELISLLEKGINIEIKNGRYIIGAVVLDVTIRKSTESFDAMQVRFYETNKTYIKHFLYSIGTSKVEFTEIDVAI